MNANGFKKFEHDSPYGRFGFRQNLPVCIQHHGSGIPPARRSQTETTDTSRCRSSSLRVIRAPEEKPNMAYLLLTATQKKVYRVAGRDEKNCSQAGTAAEPVQAGSGRSAGPVTEH
jgi:hypothetical protein